MGRFDVFEIELTRKGPHLTGEVVAGQLLLKPKKETTVARVVIHIYGGGKVEFAKSRGAQATGPTPAVLYQDSQSYLRLSQVLKDSGTLAKGQTHRLPFELRLPERLPSSFMTVITYSATALVDRGAAGKSCTLTRLLIVIGDVDLSLLRPAGCDDLWKPMEAWGHWHSGGSQKQKVHQLEEVGLATVRLVADKRAFAIGEAIQLCVEVRNNTKLRLESIRVCLIQKAEFRATATDDGSQAVRVQRLAVQHSRLQDRLKTGACLFEDKVELPVPWLATTAGSAGCRLLRISYSLQVVCSVVPGLNPVASSEPPVQTLYLGPKFDKPEQVLVLVEEPVTIGTRPLVSVKAAAASAGPAPAAEVMTQASAPPDFLQDLTLFSLAPSAPPSYEDSMMQQRQAAAAAGHGADFGGELDKGKA